MTVVLRVVGALLLLAGALAAREQARLVRAEASAWQQLITFQYDGALPAGPPGGLWAPAAAAVLEREQREATVEYWLGRYDALVEQRSGTTDPDVLFVAANAAYRSAWRDRSGPDGMRKLEGVIQAYAAVLRADPGYTDAAFNLELVARRRDQLARQKPVQMSTAIGEPRGAGPVRTADLPVGPTIHGIPGGPPVNVPVEEFEVLIPREAGEEEAPPGQAGGGRFRRKG